MAALLFWGFSPKQCSLPARHSTGAPAVVGTGTRGRHRPHLGEPWGHQTQSPPLGWSGWHLGEDPGAWGWLGKPQKFVQTALLQHKAPRSAFPNVHSCGPAPETSGKGARGLGVNPGETSPGGVFSGGGSWGGSSRRNPCWRCFSLGNEPPLWGFFPAHPSDGHPAWGGCCGGMGGAQGRQVAEVSTFSFFFSFCKLKIKI